MSTELQKEVNVSAALEEEKIQRKARLSGSREFEDWKDISRHPSYTNFKLPYHMECLVRYRRTRELYEKQFQREIAQLLGQQSSAYEAARFQRYMSISTLWPPLHNRRELEMVQRSFFPLTPKQQKHYNYLMSTNII